MRNIYLLLIVLVIVATIILYKNKEKFDIPTCKNVNVYSESNFCCPNGVPSFKRVPDCCESSGWGWNTGPGYGAGYGTGYGLYGVWPSKIPTRPWKYWMWGRRPSVFVDRETEAPQIDYGYRRV